MKKILSTILILVLLASCTTDENSTISNEKLTINLALEKVKLQSINSEKPIEFDIAIDENNSVLLGIAEIVPPSRFKEDFSKTFGNTNTSFKELLKRGKNEKSQVCCEVNGQNIGCISCKDGDGVCVAESVQACLNDGGCSTVCPQKIRYVPSLKTFYVSKTNNG